MFNVKFTVQRPKNMSAKYLNIFLKKLADMSQHDNQINNQMELLQSQARTEMELSGTPAVRSFGI